MEKWTDASKSKRVWFAKTHLKWRVDGLGDRRPA